MFCWQQRAPAPPSSSSSDSSYPDSPPESQDIREVLSGTEVVSEEVVTEPQVAMHLGSSSSVAIDAPDTVPYTVYAALLRENHSLEGQIQMLRSFIDTPSGSASTSSCAPHHVSRLRKLAREGQEQLNAMPPVGSAKISQMRMFFQMMVDELQRIVDSM